MILFQHPEGTAMGSEVKGAEGGGDPLSLGDNLQLNMDDAAKVKLSNNVFYDRLSLMTKNSGPQRVVVQNRFCCIHQIPKYCRYFT